MRKGCQEEERMSGGQTGWVICLVEKEAGCLRLTF